MDRVFFLGAGVSLCAYSFSITGLFQQAMLALQTHDQSLYGLAINAMTRIYPDFHPSLPWMNKNDIEDALDLLEAYDELFGNYELVYGSRDYFKRAQKALMYGICWAFEPILGIKDPKPLRNFVKKLEIGDCIITLNWDPVTEKLLYENYPTENILYCPDHFNKEEAKKKITFIKLHGSLDWFCDNDGGKIPEEMKQSHISFGHTLWRTKGFTPITNRFPGALPFIIPPKSRKNYDNYDIKQLWECAFWYLQSTSKIYVIGSSVRDTDLNVRALLQNSIKNGGAEIIVINKEICDEARYQGEYKNSLNYRFRVNITNNFLYIELPFEKWDMAQDA